MKSRREIEVYKILKRVSENKNITLKKEKDRFIIGDDYIKVLKNGSIKINEELTDLNKLSYL